MNGKRRVWAAVLALLLALFSGLAIHFSLRHRGSPSPQSARSKSPVARSEGDELRYRSVPFVELVYEQDFAPLPPLPETAPDADPFAGYVYVRDSAQLWAADGEGGLAKSPAVLGVKLIDRHLVHPEGWSMLLPAPGGRVTWSSRAGSGLPGPEITRLLGRFRLAVEARLRIESAECTIEVDDRRVAVPPGPGRTVWERAEKIEFDAFLRDLREAVPELGEVSAEEAKAIRALADPDGDGRVEVHARLSAYFHGSVSLADRSPADLLEDAERSAQLGDFDRAEALLRLHMAVMPGSSQVGELRRKIRTWRSEGTRFHRLHGVVRFPGGGSEGETIVAVRRTSGSKRDYPWARPGDRFEFRLAAGEYEVVAVADGYREKSVVVVLDQDREVTFDFAAADRDR